MASVFIGILLSLVLAVLVFIAYQVRLIARGRAGRESGSGEMKGSGATINVNLAPGTAPLVSVPDGKLKLQGGGEIEGKASAPVAEAVEGTTARPPTAERKSSPIAVVCPRCKQENSSYRIECFNCGNPL